MQRGAELEKTNKKGKKYASAKISAYTSHLTS